MTREEMLVSLYGDYTEVKRSFERDLVNLAADLDRRRRAKNDLQQAQEELKAAESAVVLSETHKEGKINGKNAEARAHQTTVLLAEFRANDPDAHKLATTIDVAENTLTQFDVTIEVVKARLYSYQALARMNAGLATALGGTV